MQLWCLFGSYGHAFSAKEVIFKRISIGDGLSQSSVTCILQDRRGFMWFGTQDGLNRYDGYEFRIYSHDSRDYETISDNYIRCIYEDRYGRMWIGTNGGGLNRFDRKTERFICYLNDPANSDSLSANDIRSIYEDRSGILWIGTYGGGLNRLNRKNLEYDHFMLDLNFSGSLSDNVDYFIKKGAEAYKKEVTGISSGLLQLLSGYDFPGNIIELESMVYDAVSRHSSGSLSLEVFSEKIKEPGYKKNDSP